MTINGSSVAMWDIETQLLKNEDEELVTKLSSGNAVSICLHQLRKNVGNFLEYICEWVGFPLKLEAAAFNVTESGLHSESFMMIFKIFGKSRKATASKGKLLKSMF